jgi:hypothetical protein
MRQVYSLIAPVFLTLTCILLVLILAGLVVKELKRGQPATVYFKTGVVAGDSREGVVTKRDRYITIKSDAGTEVFTWEQIRSISEKEEPNSNQGERIVDLIDLLSKVGIAATVLFFTVGLIQYRQGQKWEREKFLAATIKEFIEWYRNRNAMAMIDLLALYPKGRVVELFPHDEKDKKVLLSTDDIYKALTTNSAAHLDETDVRAIAIRECFDSFLSYMNTFNHYVEQRLITQDALSAHIGYWFILLGPEGDLSKKYKKRIFAYATKYELFGFEKLVERYNKLPVSERIRRWFKKA